MSVQSYPWEKPLFALADSGRHRQVESDTHHIRAAELPGAYDYCAQLTADHSRSFYLASGFLPQAKRSAVRALYSFCRTTDDIVDFPTADVAERLEAWRQRTQTWHHAADEPVLLAWADARRRYQVPSVYAEQLIDGVRRDLTQTRYQTFEELAEYCYGVASTVGLMSMYIVGFRDEEAIPYAVRLGVALQLTNILRDVAEDWQRGRLYLPQDELAEYGLTEADIDAGVVTDAWRAFMRFQVARARRLYREAWPGIKLLALDGRMAIAAAAGFYAAILDDIEAHDYDVFSRRAHVSGWGKISRVPGLVWRVAT